MFQENKLLKVIEIMLYKPIFIVHVVNGPLKSYVVVQKALQLQKWMGLK